MIREWILNNVINCPVRDEILVEKLMTRNHRPVGTEYEYKI